MMMVALRQHRAGIAVIGGFAALIVVTMVLAMGSLKPDDEMSFWLDYSLYLEPLLSAPTVLGGLIAVFWAAPLLSREYENRTHLFAWSQDVSPARWLAGKVVVLAAIAVVLAAVVGGLADGLVQGIDSVLRERSPLHPFGNESFDANAFLVAAHTLFGFALGLAFSALTRHTLVAMGLTVFVYAGTRMFVAMFVRPYYITPVHSFRPWDPPGQDYVMQVPQDGLRTDSGYADAAGNPMDVPQPCLQDNGDYEACIRNNGVAGHFAEFQPADRVPAFQLIETGLFLLLAAVLFTLAFVWVRRQRRI